VRVEHAEELVAVAERPRHSGEDTKEEDDEGEVVATVRRLAVGVEGLVCGDKRSCVGRQKISDQLKPRPGRGPSRHGLMCRSDRSLQGLV
jgi:hypothetical protein